jgi:hypothetical protein
MLLLLAITAVPLPVTVVIMSQVANGHCQNVAVDAADAADAAECL